MFSSRIQTDLTPNRLTRAVSELRASGRSLIDLTESNPTRAAFDYPPDILAPLSGPAGLRYLPSPLGSASAREAVARDYLRHGAAVPPERVVLTASTSDAYSIVFKVLCNPGDEVLVPRPSYPLFEYLTRLDAVVARPYDLEYHGVWSIDFATVERAWSPRSRAVLIVSPNNPTGSFVSSGDLTRLAAMAGSSGAALVADEVFADYELVPGGARAAGHCAACSSALTFSLGGLSKSVGLPQIKLGWMVVSGPEPLVTEALARVELVCDSYLSVSTPAQEAAGELLGRGAAIRQQIQARVSGNYRWLVEAAAPVASCRVLDAQGGWYGVVQVPSIATEENLVLDLLRREGVLVHPGYFFDFPRESYLVVSLLTPSASFKQGISRILARFDAPGRP